MAKRKRKKKAPTPILGRSPAALFRFAVRDEYSRATIDASVLGKVSAEQVAKDGGSLVAAAEGPRDTVELLPKLKRAALRAWEIRLREFAPPDVAPLLADVLDELYTHPNELERERSYDAVIGSLRWMGEDGAAVLESRFAGLPPSAACRAAVALGLMGRGETAGSLRDWYRAVREQPGYDHAGALWGLADLHDNKVTPLLLEEFSRRDRLPELFDLCILAGDVALVPPLLLEVHRSGGARGPLDALYAIYWRAGRDEFMAAAEDAGIGRESVEPLADAFETARPSDQQLRSLRGEPTPPPQ